MRTEDFDYELPGDLIAQFPASRREEARLMVLRRDTGQIHHSRIVDLIDWVEVGDLLVVNDTRVIPARLKGRKRSGGKTEILLCEPLGFDGTPVPPIEGSGAFRHPMWRCFIQSRGKAHHGMEVIFSEKAKGVLHRLDGGGWYIHFSDVDDLRQLMDEVGEMPLPPYIQRNVSAMDRGRYQTMFARHEGSIAAPTAGLHFTEEVLSLLKSKGVRLASVTLQIGVGTFLPVRTPRAEDHRMHHEYVEIGEECCQAWHETRGNGGRVICVGSTTVRALETAIKKAGQMAPFRGFTSLFILPGYQFRATDALITNFHLPRSTLLMLVMALAGKEQIKRAYKEAIRKGYRFYSYGDAMLIQ